MGTNYGIIWILLAFVAFSASKEFGGVHKVTKQINRNPLRRLKLNCTESNRIMMILLAEIECRTGCKVCDQANKHVTYQIISNCSKQAKCEVSPRYPTSCPDNTGVIMVKYICVSSENTNDFCETTEMENLGSIMTSKDYPHPISSSDDEYTCKCELSSNTPIKLSIIELDLGTSKDGICHEMVTKPPFQIEPPCQYLVKKPNIISSNAITVRFTYKQKVTGGRFALAYKSNETVRRVCTCLNPASTTGACTTTQNTPTTSTSTTTWSESTITRSASSTSDPVHQIWTTTPETTSTTELMSVTTSESTTGTDTTTYEATTDDKTTTGITSEIHTDENSSATNTASSLMSIHSTTTRLVATITVNNTTTFTTEAIQKEPTTNTHNSLTPNQTTSGYETTTALGNGQVAAVASNGVLVGGVVGAVGLVAVLLLVIGILLYRRRHRPAAEKKTNTSNWDDPEHRSVAFQDDLPTAAFSSQNRNHIHAVTNDDHQYTSLNKNKGEHEPTYNSLEISDVYTHLENATFGNAIYNVIGSENPDNNGEYTLLNLQNKSNQERQNKVYEPTYFELEQKSEGTPQPTYFELEQSELPVNADVQPTYFELEGRNTEDHGDNAQPTYFELEQDVNINNKVSPEQLNHTEEPTKDETPAYFELENTSTDIPRNSYLESADSEKDDYHYAYSHFKHKKDGQQPEKNNDSTEMIENDVHEAS